MSRFYPNLELNGHGTPRRNFGSFDQNVAAMVMVDAVYVFAYFLLEISSRGK